MKTHTARWYQNSPTTWLLKERAQDGGAVLATIEQFNHFRWHWSDGATFGFAETRRTAMRRARAALGQEDG